MVYWSPHARFGLASLGVVVGWCLASVPLIEAQEVQPIPGTPVAGRRIFVERGCEQCHSIWGNGGTLGPDFAIVGAGRSLQQLAGMFWNHTPRMIGAVREQGFAWPTLSEEELADLISYVYYVKLFDEPGDATLGERWFREKRCAECHAVGNVGASVGPRLDGYARYIAPLALAQGMWNHGPTMQAQLSALRISMPLFGGHQIADIQAYIRQISFLRDREAVLLQPPDPNRGRDLFSNKGCTTCHGANGRGTRSGPDLREATQQLHVSEIAGALWNHSAQMVGAMRARGIAFPRFQDGEMGDIIAFLYYLRFYEQEGDEQVGAELFVSKGCAGCHPRVAGESAMGPDLAQSEAVLSPLGLAAAMWNHAPAMYDLVQLQHVEWPRFEANEMRDLSFYMRRRAATGSSP